MFRPYDPKFIPIIDPGAPGPLDTIFADPEYPGFLCGTCSGCGEKLFSFSASNVRRFIEDHAHPAETVLGQTAVIEQPSLF
jgi:hypothetical protein